MRGDNIDSVMSVIFWHRPCCC